MKRVPELTVINILLADDDVDDCLFFEKVLKEISIKTNLSIVNDGEQVVAYLLKNMAKLPDVIFLDLNMPRKNGFECLSIIKVRTRLMDCLSSVKFSDFRIKSSAPSSNNIFTISCS